MNKFSRGSEWRKWDLHAHTAIDRDWEEKVTTSGIDAKRDFAKKYIDFAVEQRLSAIAITDHNFCNNIDECLIPYIQEEAKNKNIVIFPGFEITTTDGSGIHLLVIFPENTDLTSIYEIVKQCFPVGTKLIGSTIPGSAKSISEIKEIINQACLSSLFIFAHADSSNGVFNFKTINGQRRIQEWQNEQVQITQISKPLNDQTWGDFYKSVFNKTNSDYARNMSYIMASDCRRITKEGISDRNCLGEKFTWIKADLTFEGLKQIIREPNERIFIGEEPPKLNDIKLNKTKYINELEVYSGDSPEKWFESKIKLNPELISIIGNKGSGKSALADIIGLLGNSYNIEHFSFLNSKKFYKIIPGRSHKAKLYWKNQFSEEQKALVEEFSLTSQTQKDQIERVRYVPQNYFEQICNLTDEQDGFKKEIEKVIFNHLKIEECLGTENFKDLIKIKKDSIKKEISRLKSELDEVIDNYVNHETTLATSNINFHKSKLEEFIRQNQDIEAEIIALLEPSKPSSVIDNTILVDIEKVIKVKEFIVVQLKDELNVITQHEHICNNVLSRLETFEAQCESFKIDLDNDLKVIQINFTDIAKFDINKSPIECKKQIFIQNKDLKLNEIDKIEKEIEVLKNNKKIEEEKLSGEYKLYQEYLNKKTELEKRKQEILGNQQSPFEIKDTYFYYEHLCSKDYICAITKQKLDLYNKIKDYSGQIFDKLIEIKDVYQSLSNDVENYIKEFKEIPEANIDISFNTDIKINQDDFENKIMSYIAKRGNFYGEKKEQTFKTLFYDTSLDSKGTLLKMCDSFIQEITDKNEQTIANSLKISGLENWKALYKYIFSLDYLDVGYDLEFNHKTISLLSPGERGLLLLIFFLLADKSTVPLILDQPEENLDNQTIHNVLVPMIKNAKKKRQVIIVTHNPNLAVVCDSEQIIYSEFSSTDFPKIKYIVGSIENPVINEKLVNILEGTMPAFRARDNTYFKF